MTIATASSVNVLEEKRKLLHFLKKLQKFHYEKSNGTEIPVTTLKKKNKKWVELARLSS